MEKEESPHGALTSILCLLSTMLETLLPCFLHNDGLDFLKPESKICNFSLSLSDMW